MAKRPITISIRDEDLKALDKFAAPRRLSRGDAVGVLLEERSLTPPNQPVWDTEEQMKSEIPRSRLDEAREVLARAEAGENKGAFDVGKVPTPQILKKRDPMSQVEEYDDVPDAAPEDFDQTRRRR